MPSKFDHGTVARYEELAGKFERGNQKQRNTCILII